MGFGCAAVVGDLHHELESLQQALEDPARADEMDKILDRFGHVQEEYENLGGYALEAQAREVLHGLGFKDDQIDGDVGSTADGRTYHLDLDSTPAFGFMGAAPQSASAFEPSRLPRSASAGLRRPASKKTGTVCHLS